MAKDICYGCDGRGYDPDTKCKCEQCKGAGVINQEKSIKNENIVKEEEKKK